MNVVAHSESNLSPGTRSVCTMYLRDAVALAGPQEWATALEPGDLLFGRGAGNWLSDLVIEIDGYWSHAMLYVGDGQVAHAMAGGVGLASLEMIDGVYPAGVGVARPARSQTQRQAAADWAVEIAGIGPEQRPGKYSAYELGMAYALLRRARARGPLLRSIATISSEDPDDLHVAVEQGLADDGLLLDEELYRGTCSGFVYESYAQGAEAALSITTAPGLRLENGRLSQPEGVDVYETLTTIKTEGDDGSGYEGLGLEKLSRWKDRAILIGTALAGWASVAVTGASVPVEQGVSPGDLWCSAEIDHRWFLRPDHAKTAYSATGHC